MHGEDQDRRAEAHMRDTCGASALNQTTPGTAEAGEVFAKQRAFEEQIRAGLGPKRPYYDPNVATTGYMEVLDAGPIAGPSEVLSNTADEYEKAAYVLTEQAQHALAKASHYRRLAQECRIASQHHDVVKGAVIARDLDETGFPRNR